MHPSNKVTVENVGDIMRYHRPRPGQPERFERIAAAAEAFAREILENAPDCADRSASLRKVREARMDANSAIALEPIEPGEVRP